MVPNTNLTPLKIGYGIELDGRVVADIEAIQGAIAFGQTPEEATRKVLAIALEVIADEIAHGERPVDDLVISVKRQPFNPQKAKLSTKYAIESEYTLGELMARTDFDSICKEEDIKDWLDIKPVGREIM